jgi:hypothetical protein
VNPKRKLLLMFLLDCLVFSVFFAALFFTSLKNSHGPRILGLFLFSIYSLTRSCTRSRQASTAQKTTLIETAKALLTLVGFALFLTVGVVLGDSLNVLETSTLFLILLWLFGVLAFFWRFTDELTKLKSAAI